MIIGMFTILSIMSVIIKVMLIIVTITGIITCEADKEQFMNWNFLHQVELRAGERGGCQLVEHDLALPRRQLRQHLHPLMAEAFPSSWPLHFI